MKSEDFYTKIWRIVLRFLFTIFFLDYKIENRERLENMEKPFIVASNHISNLDPPLLVFLPVRLSYMAKKSLDKVPVLSWIMKKSGFFTINRGVPDSRSIKIALKKLEDKEVLGLFPEGTRSRDGKLKRGKPGAGMLASKAKVPIVPVAISGSNKILPKGKLVPRLSSIVVKIGNPIFIEKYFPNEPETREEEKKRYQDISDLIILKISKLNGSEVPKGIDVEYFLKLEQKF